jgi:hypothetical protein
MSWFRRIDPAIKDMILKQAKEDHRPIAEISAEFWVHVKTIYNWLGSEVHTTGKTDSQYLTEIHKLQREKEDLLKIVWAMTVVVDRLKKKDEEDRLRTRSSQRKYWSQ